MTDILLIQPPVRDFYLTSKRTIPYGLASIASSLQNAGFSVEIFDALATSKSRKLQIPGEMAFLDEYYGKEDLSPFSLFNSFKHFGYGFERIGKAAAMSGAWLVGISSLFTPYAGYALRSAEAVKTFSPACKTVLGGHHPTALPGVVMENGAVDYVIRGEGEISMLLLAEALKSGTGLDSIPGIVFREKDGGIKINEPAVIQNPDNLPFPATGLLDHDFYRRRGTASAVISASRGCPMKCSYCSVGASSFMKYRRRSVGSVLGELDRIINENKAGFIDFEDENLSLDRKWFMTLLDEIKTRFGKSGTELRAMNGLFPPSLDEEMVRLMKEAGFKTLNLSLGSFSSAQLERFGRPDVRDAFDRALLHAGKYGLDAVGYIIAGAPFQTPEDSVSDILCLAGRRVLAGVSIFYPSPGSPDFGLCDKLGILPETFSLMRSSAVPVSHTTSRKQAVTLMRLGRILNFMKSLKDSGVEIPEPSPAAKKEIKTGDRTEAGIELLKGFLHDGKIRGIDRRGTVYEHSICNETAGLFVNGIKQVKLRGCRI
ncbi:MAG: anaerobic magnesium-protoporphyrin monomethyl ester cyclase [Thermodesulfobacteriota bacterium]|nr:anaerobic magnesium-protoporphyrin monomethyl ester cyclase [Thermodesulfobacteriota bacterium]